MKGVVEYSSSSLIAYIEWTYKTTTREGGRDRC
jgi:hypothetical protein